MVDSVRAGQPGGSAGPGEAADGHRHGRRPDAPGVRDPALDDRAEPAEHVGPVRGARDGRGVGRRCAPERLRLDRHLPAGGPSGLGRQPVRRRPHGRRRGPGARRGNSPRPGRRQPQPRLAVQELRPRRDGRGHLQLGDAHRRRRRQQPRTREPARVSGEHSPCAHGRRAGQNGAPALFSSGSQHVDLAAPGVDIPVAVPTTYHPPNFYEDDGLQRDELRRTARLRGGRLGLDRATDARRHAAVRRDAGLGAGRVLARLRHVLRLRPAGCSRCAHRRSTRARSAGAERGRHVREASRASASGSGAAHRRRQAERSRERAPGCRR